MSSAVKPPANTIVFAAALFLVLVAGIVAVGTWYHRHLTADFRRRVEGQLATVADLKVAQIARWRAERLGDAGTIRDNPLFAGPLARALTGAIGTDAAGIRAGLEALRAHFDYDPVLLVDPAGQVVMTAGQAERELGVCGKELLRTALQTDEPFLSDFHSADPVRQVHLDVVVPLRRPFSSDPGSAGALILRIDPSKYLYPLIQTWPTPSATAETLLVRAEGRDVLFLNELRHQTNTAMRLRLPVTHGDLPAAMAVRGTEGTVEGTDYRGAHVVAAVRHIPASPWFLVAKMDTDEAYAGMRLRTKLTFAGMFSLLLAAGLGTGFLWMGERAAHFRREIDAERGLRESELRFRAIFEQAAVGVAQVGPDGRWLDVNQRLCEIVGYTHDELLACAFQDITHPEDLQADLNQVQRLLAGEIQTYGMEKRYLRKDRSPVWIYLTVSLVRSPSGAPAYFIAVVEDIDVRKRAEEELRAHREHLEELVAQRTAALRESEQAVRRLNDDLRRRAEELHTVNKELEAFSYSVSHDLKAPLRSVDGFAKMIEEDYADRLDEEGRRRLKVVRDSAREMGQLINDLLTFSRLSRTAMRMTQIDMRAVVATAQRKVESAEPGRTLLWKCGDLPPARGDEATLLEVWLNLLSNAAKYTRPREDPTIIIEGRTDGDEIVYSVMDNGVGFDMAYKDKLFTVFQRLHKTDEFEGTGIGLALVQRIVQRHGGRVWAEGKVGEGAAFHFTLPRETNAARTEQRRRAPRS